MDSVLQKTGRVFAMNAPHGVRSTITCNKKMMSRDHRVSESQDLRAC